MGTDNVRNRESLARTFTAACKASTSAGVTSGPGLPLNPASVTALLLVACGSASDAIDAVRRMPPGDVWSDVIAYLQPLADEERADTQRPIALGGARR